MDTTKAIETHRQAMLRLLMELFALAGLSLEGAPAVRLSQTVRRAIHRVLLPMESATKRLIFVLAERLPKTEDAESEPMRQRTKSTRRGKGAGTRAPVFALFDKQKYFAELAAMKQRFVKGPGPRISFFDDRDAPREPVVEKALRDPDNAVRLCRRMHALLRALKDMDAQARRLRRIMDKRADDPFKPGHTNPMRQGPAPGRRVKHTHEVDGILYECSMLAYRQYTSPDTS